MQYQKNLLKPGFNKFFGEYATCRHEIQVRKKRTKFHIRRGRDSNPRGTFAPNTLAVCCFQPLSHLSAFHFSCILPFLSEKFKIPATPWRKPEFVDWDIICILGLCYFASVIPHTSFAPDLRKTRAHSFMVEPEV